MKLKKLTKYIITSSLTLMLLLALNSATSNANARHIHTHHHINTEKIYRIKLRNRRHRNKKRKQRRSLKINRIKRRNYRIKLRNLRHRNKKRSHTMYYHKIPKLMTLSLNANQPNQDQLIKKALYKDLIKYRTKVLNDDIYAGPDQQYITESKSLDEIANHRANQIADYDYNVYDKNCDILGYVNEPGDYSIPDSWSENIDTTYNNNPHTNNPQQIADFITNQFAKDNGPVKAGGSISPSDPGSAQNMKNGGYDVGIGVTNRPNHGYYVSEDFEE